MGKKSTNIPEDIDDWIKEINTNKFKTQNIDIDDWIRQNTQRDFDAKQQFMENARKRKMRQRQYGSEDEFTDIDDLGPKYKFGYSSEHYQNYEKQFIKKVFKPSKSTTEETKPNVVVSRNWFMDICISWINSKRKVVLLIFVILGFELGILSIVTSSFDS